MGTISVGQTRPITIETGTFASCVRKSRKIIGRGAITMATTVAMTGTATIIRGGKKDSVGECSKGLIGGRQSGSEADEFGDGLLSFFFLESLNRVRHNRDAAPAFE